jgi:hypothetical protein
LLGEEGNSGNFLEEAICAREKCDRQKNEEDAVAQEDGNAADDRGIALAGA